MSDGSGRRSRENLRVSTERLIRQRNEAREERDSLLDVVKLLVRLQDGPRSVHYHGAMERAWDCAREAIGG